MGDEIQHPQVSVEDFSTEELRRFYGAPMDGAYFDNWVAWLMAAFDYQASKQRVKILRDILIREKFTNAELGIAGDWIISHCERFPVPTHFLDCPALGRNMRGG